MEENKKINKSILILSIFLLLFSFGCITYAYFNAVDDKGKSVDTIIGTSTSDSELIQTGDRLYIYAHTMNFGESKSAGSLQDSTYVRVSLRANEDEGYAEDYYYVYLVINENDFTYSTEVGKPELLLQLYDPDGNEIVQEKYQGLDYVTVTDKNEVTYSGYDITTFRGILRIARQYQIESYSSAITTNQYWDATVTFVNYDEHQKANEGRKLDGEMIVTKNPFSSQSEITLKVVKEGEKVGTVRVVTGETDTTEDTVYVQSGDIVTFYFSENNGYFVESVENCAVTPEYNADGVSIKSAVMEDFFSKDTICIVHYAKLHKWQEYNRGTTTTNKDCKTVCTQCCDTTGMFCSSTQYRDSSGGCRYGKGSCSMKCSGGTTSYYYTATDSYVYAFDETKYGTSTNASSPSECSTGYGFCVKIY